MLDQYPEELKYSEAHAWVRIVEDGSYVLVGVTSYVVNSQEDVNYIELPEKDLEIDANEEIGLLELSDGSGGYEFYTPVSGEIVTVNEELDESPRLINTDPYGDGWICKIKLSDPTELEDLMSSEEYKEFLTVLEGEE